MKKSKVYTRTGDKGMTGLIGGTRVSKTDIRVEAYGSVDELNAHLGELVAWLPEGRERNFLLKIQSTLFCVGGYLATDTAVVDSSKTLSVTAEDVACLEREIDETEEGLPGWKGFILPGGSKTAAICHVCRTVCRRAERRILELLSTTEVAPEVCAYVNRLSDYLFVLSRRILYNEGKDEIIWNKC